MAVNSNVIDYYNFLLKSVRESTTINSETENSGKNITLNISNDYSRTKLYEELITKFNKHFNDSANEEKVFAILAESSQSTQGVLKIKLKKNLYKEDKNGSLTLFTLVLKNKNPNFGNLAEVIYGFVCCAYYKTKNDIKIKDIVITLMKKFGEAISTKINDSTISSFKVEDLKLDDKIQCNIDIGKNTANICHSLYSGKIDNVLTTEINKIIENAKKIIKTNEIYKIAQIEKMDGISKIECKLIGGSNTDTNKADLSFTINKKDGNVINFDVSLKNGNVQVAQAGLSEFTKLEVSEKFLNFFKNYLGLSDQSIEQLRRTYSNNLDLIKSSTEIINVNDLSNRLFHVVSVAFVNDIKNNHQGIIDGFKKSIMGLERYKEGDNFFLEDIKSGHRLTPVEIESLVEKINYYVKRSDVKVNIVRNSTNIIRFCINYQNKKQYEIFQVRLKQENKTNGIYLRIYLEFKDGMYKYLKEAF